MSSPQHFDAIVIGTGFGGSATALQLARAGKSVLVLDRGRWVDRDDSAWSPRMILTDRKYRSETPYEAPQAVRRKLMFPNATIGGSSVFYGAASFRLREADFERRSHPLVQGALADGYVDWPISYPDLAPYYDQAEQLLGVVGEAGVDPTEPPRTTAYGAAPPEYGSSARKIAEAAQRLGLQPFRIPLAINFPNGKPNGRSTCIRCTTCDLFPCKLGAKNDVSVTILPEAIRHGAELWGETVAVRIDHTGGRVTGVDCLDLRTGTRSTVSADAVVVSGGASPSARLLLVSGFGDVGPNGQLIGRYLMRHCSGVSIGLFPFQTNPERMFNKQVAITDFYFGHPHRKHGPDGRWGMIQVLQVAPPEYMRLEAPFPINRIGEWTIRYQIYLLCLAEDIPQAQNRVTLHLSRTDQTGHPLASVYYRHHRRDHQGRRALHREASRILRAAGAYLRLHKPIYTFSHALGTCRFGTDPQHAVLDPACRVFGVPNLFVVDGSFMPSSGGVNPSLTIAANALRVGQHMTEHWGTIASGRGDR